MRQYASERAGREALKRRDSMLSLGDFSPNDLAPPLENHEPDARDRRRARGWPGRLRMIPKANIGGLVVERLAMRAQCSTGCSWDENALIACDCDDRARRAA